MTENEFRNRISEIDEELILENIPIPNRPLHAIQRFAIKYKTRIYLGNPDTNRFNKSKYDDYNLGNTINEWYKQKYGKKLAADISIGHIGLLIAGDVYKLRIPIFYCALVGEKNGKRVRLTRIPDEQLVRINIFNFIDSITTEIVNTMGEEDKRKVYAIFNHGVELANLFGDKNINSELTKSAKVDIEKAIDYLLGTNISIGMSRWSSLQATEKIIKNAIFLRRGKFAKTHNLQQLMDELYSLGFPKSDNSLIEQVQCSPSIRYGDNSSTIAEAIKAHHLSIFIGCRVMMFSVLTSNEN